MGNLTQKKTLDPSTQTLAGNGKPVAASKAKPGKTNKRTRLTK